jgi:hypothetical protein
MLSPAESRTPARSRAALRTAYPHGSGE